MDERLTGPAILGVNQSEILVSLLGPSDLHPQSQVVSQQKKMITCTAQILIYLLQNI